MQFPWKLLTNRWALEFRTTLQSYFLLYYGTQQDGFHITLKLIKLLSTHDIENHSRWKLISNKLSRPLQKGTRIFLIFMGEFCFAWLLHTMRLKFRKRRLLCFAYRWCIRNSSMNWSSRGESWSDSPFPWDIFSITYFLEERKIRKWLLNFVAKPH